MKDCCVLCRGCKSQSLTAAYSAGLGLQVRMGTIIFSFNLQCQSIYGLF